MRPEFCPWCGASIAYEADEHDPGYALLAEQARVRGEEPPPFPQRVREMLTGDAFVGACAGCGTISHVVGHRPPPR